MPVGYRSVLQLSVALTFWLSVVHACRFPIGVLANRVGPVFRRFLIGVLAVRGLNILAVGDLSI